MEYTCPDCPQRFLLNDDLLSHYLTLHMCSPPLPVPQPPQKPPTETLFVPQETRKSDFKNVCTLCNSSFIARKNLQRHMESAHGTQSSLTSVGSGDLACADCGKRFSSRYNLERHMQLHRGVRYSCTICTKVYTQKYAWSQHMKAAHKEWREKRHYAVGVTGDEELIHN